MNIPFVADVCNSATVSCMNYMIYFKRVYNHATVNVHCTQVCNISPLDKRECKQDLINYRYPNQ